MQILSFFFFLTTILSCEKYDNHWICTLWITKKIINENTKEKRKDKQITKKNNKENNKEKKIWK